MRHVDILDERDSLKGSFFGSVVLHASVCGIIMTATAFQIGGQRTLMGVPDSLGGSAVSVSAVQSIPMPKRSGPVNRVANDTDSQVPAPPKPEPKKAVAKPDPDAIALKSKRAPQAVKPKPATTGRAAQKQEYADNQLTSRSGAAASSQMFQQAPGSGGVGVGTGAPFGYQFGAYSILVRDRVAQRWRTDQVESRLRSLPAAILSFQIQRNGAAGNIRIIQSSGNRALDYSAERAILEASPFPPLPAQYSGSSATVEFHFQLQR